MEGPTMEKDDRSSIVFRTKLENVKDALNMLLDKGIITADTYIKFLVRMLEVRTMEEVDELITQVAELCKRGGKKNEN
jgi:hypothetical protein